MVTAAQLFAMVRDLAEGLRRDPAAAAVFPVHEWRAAAALLEAQLPLGASSPRRPTGAALQLRKATPTEERFISMHRLPRDALRAILMHCPLDTLSVLEGVGTGWHRPRVTEVQRAARAVFERHHGRICVSLPSCPVSARLPRRCSARRRAS